MFFKLSRLITCPVHLSNLELKISKSLVLKLTGLAQLMSMISAIKSAQGYANGGVIGGHSYTGDKLMARVNSREVILNEKQQKNALNAMDNIDNTITQNINVDGRWELYGDKLYLCLKNYSKGQSKLGKNIGIH